jgi:hypothetical protein
MIPCDFVIRISICCALLFCVGCGQSLFSLEKKNEAAPQSRAIGNTSSVPMSTLPAPAEKKPVRYDAGADYTVSYHNKVLTEDVTWRGRVLITGVLTIAPHATVNIVPGTVISFVPDPNGYQEGALLVKGRIAAVGTADKQIIFKAATSDISPDTWQGIIVLGSEKVNVFEYCRIEGATVGLDSIFATLSLKHTFIRTCRTGARLQNSLFQAMNGGVSGSDVGYVLLDSESNLRDVSCTGNIMGVSLSRGSLRVKGSSFAGNTARALDAVDSKVKITGAVFLKNGTGIALVGSEGVIETSKFVENREYGLQLVNSRMKISDNLIFMNTGIGIMSDSAGSAAWGNNISRNGLYDFYNAGSEDFRAIGNWWGASAGKGQKRRIFDKAVDPSRGSVLTAPELPAPPADAL